MILSISFVIKIFSQSDDQGDLDSGKIELYNSILTTNINIKNIFSVVFIVYHFRHKINIRISLFNIEASYLALWITVIYCIIKVEKRFTSDERRDGQ